MKHPPRLAISHRGIYSFRYYQQGREFRISLKTRDPQKARHLGYLLNLELEKLRYSDRVSRESKMIGGGDKPKDQPRFSTLDVEIGAESPRFP